ncbi:MAG: glycogen synthase, partial [Syntrophobacteria bacterium]
RLLGEAAVGEPLVEDLPVPLGSRTMGADVYAEKLGSGVQVYFIRRDEFYDRGHLYGTSKGDYFDNAQRFIYFCRAVLALCPTLGAKADIIHCHDWQCGLIPAYLRLLMADDPFWAHTASMLTIHNITYQGRFGPELFPLTGLPDNFFTVDGMEFWGGINFLKAAVITADVITTVSSRYSEEIQTEAYGGGLEGILRVHRKKLHGIINGADYQAWNPETDPHLAANYSREDLEPKRLCKLDLLDTVGLPQRVADRPVLGMVSRLADQKGFDLLAGIMDRLMAEEVALVILGTGEKRYQTLLSRLAARYPDNIAVRLTFDEGLAHKIEAGADMFLMPSRFEPCGLNQIYSLRYGTVPVVRSTGGLYDTVSPYEPKTGTGVGFLFTTYEPEAFWQAIETALEFFSRPEIWQQIMKNGMAEDFSWQSAARQYLLLYEKAVEELRQRSSGRGYHGTEQAGKRGVFPAGAPHSREVP